MGEPIVAKFSATPIEVNGGDDDVRVILAVADDADSLGGAILLSSMKRQVLSVTATIGNVEIELTASIAPIQTALSFRAGKRPIIKFDIPATHAAYAMQLIAHSDSMLKFEVCAAGEKQRQKKPHIKLVREPTAYGAFWNYLDTRNFLSSPDLGELFTHLQEVHKTMDRKEIVRLCFGGKRSERVSPEKLKKWLEDHRVDSRSNVYSMIKNGREFAERKAKAA